MDSYSSYEHEDAKVEAIQEFCFTNMPPVLHVQLTRFKFDVVANVVSKNNKRFKFYPKLDLRQYCADAEYTLHSVLGKDSFCQYYFEFLRVFFFFILNLSFQKCLIVLVLR